MSQRITELQVSPRGVARALGAVAVLLVLAHLGGLFSKFAFGRDSIKGLIPLFTLSEEGNIPAYFSVLLILIAVALLVIMALSEKSRGGAFTGQWSVLAVGFLFMGFDEAFQVHELIGKGWISAIGEVRLGVQYLEWVAIVLVLILALWLMLRRFLLHLPRATRRRFFLAATVYLTGALLLDLPAPAATDARSATAWLYGAMVAAEEGLEMAGLIAFIWALLSHWTDSGTELRFRFGDAVGAHQREPGSSV